VTAGVQIRTFQINISDVGAIDRWVKGVADEWLVNERAVYLARLCIGELASNILEHSKPQEDRDHIVITIRRLADGVGVEFLDSRGAFDPTTEPSAKADFSNAGGRGLMLLQTYAEGLSYTNDGAYNRVSFNIRSA
jgi:anti-sigma regulatory factor (Ser/Thr protein kinase)